MPKASPMRAIIGLILLMLTSRSSAFAQSQDASYYCVAEAAGGLWYNTSRKKWEGTSFGPTLKFVLKMKFLQARVQKEEYGEEQEQVSDYTVTITDTGENTGLNCTGKDRSRTVTVYDKSRYFECDRAIAWNYHFNLRTNRFLMILPIGYLNGKDNNDNNPGIEAGTCTKID
jgi:hypothetical protein